ncbi:DUF371 domain-containing protein [Methanosphaera sp.]|uniref:DUF371 domain-containing protein n=1 Tax=Methanosphaera sp. TaxID=2666342 RepID=UPI0025F4592C|nr:DUF371 domain-containing protein [Methanosphaera sp.]
MQYSFIAMGHENVTSLHKSTFEITTDKTLTLKGDCIIGVKSNVTLNDLPEELKKQIQTDNEKIELFLETDNYSDKIIGYGSSKLTLDHPTDMVCRKSDFTCSRTLMINSNKAAKDLDKKLVNELKNGSELKITIKTV